MKVPRRSTGRRRRQIQKCCHPTTETRRLAKIWRVKRGGGRSINWLAIDLGEFLSSAPAHQILKRQRRVAERGNLRVSLKLQLFWLVAHGGVDARFN